MENITLQDIVDDYNRLKNQSESIKFIKRGE